MASVHTNVHKRRKLNSLPFGPLTRVKLYGEILAEFLIGNTFARSLISEKDMGHCGGRKSGRQEAAVHLLWVGVGDVRNPLLTLSGLSRNRCYALHLNDVSPVTLARDAVILAMGATRVEDAIAVWSDSVLNAETHRRLQKTLRDLLDNKYSYLDFSAAEGLQCYWRSWLEHAHSPDALSRVRSRALGVKGAGHQRVGVSESWRRLGVASSAEGDEQCSYSNPTLYDLIDEDAPKYLELQGPGAAFANLVGDIGSKEFAESLAKAWTPLLKSSWQQRVAAKRVTVHFYLGDCAAFLQRPDFASKFAAIDTSNVMDYTGMWNLALQCEPCLVRKGGRIFLWSRF